ncbi:cytochrome c-type biogenesis protein CcmH [Sulfitobacter sp. F26169L]|uniref:cytochrome c-type biogenesis protein n=1 Tax=Sulfitobacter sp. F26169L TaxID=2996015 RepID=UPI002260BF79|nr:cytochrome c-type biogenesis protein [Sulfitobacter sp. F26169L]MCX7566186.1 cytochrome c-type biogenesis protein CcmH [Sulfitobacter sp. F26169L]
MKRFALILMLLASPLAAVEPDEILSDPVLEQRARELSKGLRCLVCRNESIDESNAPLAKDLRLLVRDRLVQGDTDEEAVNFIVERYGEYVLLNPTRGGANWLLWGAGPLMLLFAGGAGIVYVRGRSRANAPQDDGLSADEAAALKDILEK